MEKIFLIINWITYGLLFGTFFIKLTDEKERDLCRKTAYLLLTMWTLYMSVMLFKIIFLIEFKKGLFGLNPYQTITNLLILFFMWSKVKEDRWFKKQTK